MAKKVSLSGEHQKLAEIALYHEDTETALKRYFTPTANRQRFLGYTQKEVKKELKSRLSELDRSSSFSILSAMEATFRIDYLLRCYGKKKDHISRKFRENYKAKGAHVSLEDDILAQWKENSTAAAGLIGDLIGAFKYRHWLAHGRYWIPKLGKKYDYPSVYLLAQTVLDRFPFET